MKGIIFNLVEEFVTTNWGEEKYEQILGKCPLQTKEPFVGPGTYPDADLMTIVGKSAEALGVSVPDALRAFGKFCFPKLAEKFPNFTNPYKHPKEFLKTIDSVIHVEVRKLMKGADTPKFVFQDSGPNRLIMEYESKRQLCPLVEGMFDGVGDFFKSPIQHNQTKCSLKSGTVCQFDLTFTA